MSSKIIKFFAFVAGAQFVLAVLVFFWSGGTTRAVLGMGIGLYVVWIIVAGLLMRKYRNTVRNFVQKIKIGWQIKFVLFATTLALAEEAVTTAMTNTASLYGLSPALAHITASANYFDVVLTNSVVLFVPMFFVWAWILSKYDVGPNTVFLLWGLSGTFMEILYGGFPHVFEIGMWMFVYGLMIYLPAYCVPKERQVKKAKWWNYPFFVLVVFLGVIPGGILATIFKFVIHPHYFPGFN